MDTEYMTIPIKRAIISDETLILLLKRINRWLSTHDMDVQDIHVYKDIEYGVWWANVDYLERQNG